MKPKKTVDLSKLPPDQWRYCKTCGAVIQPVPGLSLARYLKRQCCPQEYDKKENKCVNAWTAKINRERPKKPKETFSKKLGPCHFKNEVKPVRQKMSQEEADRLDFEQAKINIQIYAKEMTRCGYITDPGRSLTPEEIEAIKPMLSPPSTERKIVENFRPWLPRGSAPL
jgi:hypothetical protein